MSEKPWTWSSYYSDSIEELEKGIRKHGINTIDHNEESLFIAMMNNVSFCVEKIDLVFNHNPVFFKYRTNNKNIYIKFIFDFEYFAEAGYIGRERKLYIFLKIIQSMELHLIRDTDIFCVTMLTLIPHWVPKCNEETNFLEKKILTRSVMGLLDNCYLRFRRYIYLYTYYDNIFLNEIVRKTSLSEIVFKKLIKF